MTALLTIDQPAYFARLAEAERAHWWSLGMWRLAAHWLGAALRGRRGLSALDIGCGTGLTARRLAERPEIGSVIGLDPSPRALELARRYGAPLVRGSILALPFADQRFDVLTCFDVLQHLIPGDDRRALAELDRVLRPGGVALIRANGRGSNSKQRNSDAICYRLGDLAAVVEGSGLTVRRASYANFLPSLAQEMRGRLEKPFSRDARSHPAGGGLKLRRRPAIVNRLMGCVSDAEALLAGRFAIRLPFGHSTIIWAEKHAVGRGEHASPQARSQLANVRHTSKIG